LAVVAQALLQVSLPPFRDHSQLLDPDPCAFAVAALPFVGGVACLVGLITELLDFLIQMFDNL
jgi:hypothetical protein